MIPLVYDNKEGEGIDLVLDMENGLSMKMEMTDDAARELSTLLDNKLVARNK